MIEHLRHIVMVPPRSGAPSKEDGSEPIELLRDLLMLPPGGSTVADDIDLFHAFIIGTSMLGAVVVALVALEYLRRYRARGRPRTSPIARWGFPLWAELGLIGGVAVLFLGSWFVGVRQYDHMRDPPSNSMQIYVVAKQWMFKFAYPNGRTTADVLYVPAGRPVTLVMTSRDVIHSFFVPGFRIKYDVLPDRYTMMWFQAPKPGDYQILCTEFCGTGHSTMRGTVRVLDPVAYQKWLAGDTVPDTESFLDPDPLHEFRARMRPAPDIELSERGRDYAATKGCLRCHTTDGSPHIGPSFAGLYGREVALADGTTVAADEAYLTRSMMDPEADHVAGYSLVMPSYRGRLEPAEAASIVELIKSLREQTRWHTPEDRPPTDQAYPPPDAPGLPTYPGTRPEHDSRLELQR